MAYAVALNVGKLAISDIWDRLFENYKTSGKQNQVVLIKERKNYDISTNKIKNAIRVYRRNI